MSEARGGRSEEGDRRKGLERREKRGVSEAFEEAGEERAVREGMTEDVMAEVIEARRPVTKRRRKTGMSKMNTLGETLSKQKQHIQTSLPPKLLQELWYLIPQVLGKSRLLSGILTICAPKLLTKKHRAKIRRAKQAMAETIAEIMTEDAANLQST